MLNWYRYDAFGGTLEQEERVENRFQYAGSEVEATKSPLQTKGKGETGKGKSFRGGSKKSRDKWYGKNDKEFQKWWERQGKKSYGEDIQDSKMADEVYKEWIDLGKPKGR